MTTFITLTFILPLCDYFHHLKPRVPRRAPRVARPEACCLSVLHLALAGFNPISTVSRLTTLGIRALIPVLPLVIVCKLFCESLTQTYPSFSARVLMVEMTSVAVNALMVIAQIKMGFPSRSSKFVLSKLKTAVVRLARPSQKRLPRVPALTRQISWL